MYLFNHINLITVLIAGIFLLPLLTGILRPFSANNIKDSLFSMLNTLEFILGVILTVYVVRVIFSENGNRFLERLYQVIPSISGLIPRYHFNILAYAVIMFTCLMIIPSVLQAVTNPFFRYVIVPITNSISPAVNSMHHIARRIIGCIWQLPKSVLMVLIFSLVLNFYSDFTNDSDTAQYIKSSGAYQMVNQKILNPLLDSDIAKRIPVLINDSFKIADIPPRVSDTGVNDTPSGRNVWVIKYFNGVTLDEAVKSSSEIDNMAKKIVGTQKDDRKKAYLLYKWISQNIQYDDEKAKIIVTDPTRVDSGAIVAFNERKGICFDYSSLYVSMCRAVGLKVRFITGLGYSGIAWGDHAWNQVYYPKEKRWIDVDTTFGSSGYNYFDESDFSVTHQYAEVQGEW